MNIQFVLLAERAFADTLKGVNPQNFLFARTIRYSLECQLPSSLRAISESDFDGHVLKTISVLC